MAGVARPEDIEFEEEIDKKYICPICLTFYWDPVQTVCGHRFCSNCIRGVIRERYRKYNNRTYVKCPVDNKFFNAVDDLFEDKAFQREVMTLRVKCKNISHGCSWINELSEYQNHQHACQFQQVHCSFDCGATMMRSALSKHETICDRRPVHCEHCNLKIVYADLTKHQVLKCEDFPVQCTLCGQMGIRRQDIPSHINVDTGACPEIVVLCKYALYGCQYQSKRRLIMDHYKSDTDHHIFLLVQHNAHQDREIVRLKTKLDNIVEIVTERLQVQLKNL